MKIFGLAALASAAYATLLKAKTPAQATQCVQEYSISTWDVNKVLDLCRDSYLAGMGFDLGRELEVPRMSVPDVENVDLMAIDIQNVEQGEQVEQQPPTTYTRGNSGGVGSMLDVGTALDIENRVESDHDGPVDSDGELFRLEETLSNRSTSLLDISNPDMQSVNPDIKSDGLYRPESSMALVDHDYVMLPDEPHRRDSDSIGKRKKRIPAWVKAHKNKKARRKSQQEGHRRNSSFGGRQLRLSISTSASRMVRRVSSGARVMADSVQKFASQAKSKATAALVKAGWIDDPSKPKWMTSVVAAADLWRTEQAGEKHIVTESFANANILSRLMAYFADVATCEYSVDLLRPRYFRDLKRTELQPEGGNVGSVYFPKSFFEYARTRPDVQLVGETSFVELVYIALVEEDLWLRRAEMCLGYWSGKRNFPFDKFASAVLGKVVTKEVRIKGEQSDSYVIEEDPDREVRTYSRLETVRKLWSDANFVESHWDYLVRLRIVDLGLTSVDELTEDVLRGVMEAAATEYGLDHDRRENNLSYPNLMAWMGRVADGDVALWGQVRKPHGLSFPGTLQIEIGK